MARKHLSEGIGNQTASRMTVTHERALILITFINVSALRSSRASLVATPA